MPSSARRCAPGPRPSGPGTDAHATRAEIDAWPTDDALAWMRPEDLFFLQIQGSGVLVFPEGARLRAVFDGANDQPFSGDRHANARAGDARRRTPPAMPSTPGSRATGGPTRRR